ncbi:MAG: YHYH protein [Chitinophagaceae bacterium]|nr:YHYH protein [Chitinophagaceae bacterium]
MKLLKGTILILVTCLLTQCKKSSDTTTTTGGGTTAVPAVFSKFNSTVTISVEGNFVVLKSNGLPEHKSPYYQGTAWAATLYEAYNGTNPAFMINPNRIASQNLVFKIPISPAVNSTHEATPLGPIGISLNGVPLFNQYAGPSQPLTNEINSFDQYNGHPQQTGQYHYHVEPLYTTALKGKDALIGFLLDGFPVYGPKENGVTLTSANLDIYHGHTSATAEYPGGIYHYHITADAPYINGSGFYGTKGTVTQ